MMQTGYSALTKMLLAEAESDRQIYTFPSPYLVSATPYLDLAFHPQVEEVRMRGQGRIGSALRVCKAVLVGDVGVGKTSLVRKFNGQGFQNTYKATIGVDFLVERFDILGMPFNMQLWDTAGLERFRTIAASYYRGAQVLIVVFDPTHPDSLMHCPRWHQDAVSANPSRRPLCFLVGTKRDLLSDVVFKDTLRTASEMAQALDSELWLVSSKTGESVDNFFFRVAALAFQEGLLAELKGDAQGARTPISLAENTNTIGDNYGRKKQQKCFGSSSCHT